jgi:phosphohistidine swiveling domain-containing protein
MVGLQEMKQVRFVLRADESGARQAMGGKASALAALQRAHLPIPAWFVVSPAAFSASLSEAQRCAFATACAASDVETIEKMLTSVQLDRRVYTEIECEMAALCPDGAYVAVRSSALEEDDARHSFAGQLESYLFVAPERVAEKIIEVWRSGFSERVLAYRRERGLSIPAEPPAVLVQRMVEAEVAGVAFSADPVSGRRGVAVVSALYGLGTALVSGECDADTYTVARDGGILARTIAEKTCAHRHICGSIVESVPVPSALVAQPTLADEQVRAVAALARRCEEHFGCPQDIEWALADGQLFLLQARPITALSGMADPDGQYMLWDNSNIAESYNGVTTPLTFSFARYAYEQVYRQMCRVLGVPEATIARCDDIFRHMIGLIQGRVYYNLLNWYRLLALMPGFTANRKFMETMMGVKEGLPESIAAELGGSTRGERMADRMRLVTALAMLPVRYCRLPREIRRFSQRVEHALAPGSLELTDMRADELVAAYRSLEQQLIANWNAPLINDLFAMLFYGVLRTLAVKWCGDQNGSLQNDLLSGEGRIISTEPATRVRRMASLAAPDPALVECLCHDSESRILSAMAARPELQDEYRAYLERFADRCLEELKLESATLRDDPMPLLRSIGHLARRMRSEQQKHVSDDQKLRRQAEERVAEALRGHPLRRLAFAWVLKQARARVRDRENLRFERTRVFGRVRQIFRELGRRFYALDLLEEPSDIFYLEVEEALGFVSGRTTTTDLKGLVKLRRTEYARFKTLPAPADRFETRGIVNHGQSFGNGAGQESEGGETRRGTGCCPGIVRGPVRVVTDPEYAELHAGEILVARRTDPGWILLFPAASGVLVEHGSLLSHSAIVARELGIPAIVGLGDATRWLHDGDWVEMNGSSGVVSKLAAPDQEVTHG